MLSFVFLFFFQVPMVELLFFFVCLLDWYEEIALKFCIPFKRKKDFAEYILFYVRLNSWNFVLFVFVLRDWLGRREKIQVASSWERGIRQFGNIKKYIRNEYGI